MPISRDKIPLRTAKQWAKRIHHHLKDESQPSLMTCQQALARALGFAHWHALQATLGENTFSLADPPHRLPRVATTGSPPLDGAVPALGQWSAWDDPLLVGSSGLLAPTVVPKTWGISVATAASASTSSRGNEATLHAAPPAVHRESAEVHRLRTQRRMA